MKKRVDRSSDLAGVNRYTRDNRSYSQSLRNCVNFRLPDKRLTRRKSFAAVDHIAATQALSKATGVSLLKRVTENGSTRNYHWKTPLSYGLIRWQSDYQLRIAENKTIEFMARLGDYEDLVVTPFTRLSSDTGGGAVWTDYTLRTGGVYLLDQTIISNKHKFHTGVIDKAGNLVGGALVDLSVTAPNNEVFPLTTMAFKFTKDKIIFSFMLYNTATNYYVRCLDMEYAIPGGEYGEGSVYHIGIVYKAASKVLSLYVNHTIADNFQLPLANYVFVGEQDRINGINYASGQKRDIVVLNESIVRGNYSSACKMTASLQSPQCYFHSFKTTATDNRPVPWVQSPPRGTSIFDLRIWNEDRTSDLSSGLPIYSRILPSDTGITNLKGNWWLNEGGPVCYNHVTGLERRYCSVHHGYPGYVNEPDMLSGRGIKLGDGQHLILSTDEGDSFLGRGLQAKLENLLYPDPSRTAVDSHQDQHSFTIQMQFMVPDAFQAELNDDAAATATLNDIGVTEARKSMSLGVDKYNLKDGTEDAGATVRLEIAHPTDAANKQTPRAFDMTLFSIEGCQKAGLSEGNESLRRRIPLIRAVITPSQKIAFEVYKLGLTTPAAATPQIVRLLSSTSVTAGKVYAVTFVQRCNYKYDGATGNTNTEGWSVEIWIKNITDNTAIVTNSFSFGTNTAVAPDNTLTAFMMHRQNYDIIVGAGYVNSGWDFSIRDPRPGAGATVSSYNPTGVSRGDIGPWPVQQHFMTPYQDQPANIICGMFRMWTVPLPQSAIERYGISSIASADYTSDLLINLEMDSITGTRVKSKCRYLENFDMGYKGWGAPARAINRTSYVGGAVFIYDELYDGAWVHEDCLGYSAIRPQDKIGGVYDSRQTEAVVNGLSVFKGHLVNQYGLLAVNGDSVSIDNDVSGTFVDLPIVGSGLLSEFSQGAKWKGAVIGDRTFLTSIGGLPKVYDGRNLTVAGFKRWSGGVPIAYRNNTVTTMAAGWYGIVVVYFSEEHNIYHVSPVATVNIAAPGLVGITVINVPPHPDPRVSYIGFYRTQAQITENLARSAPLFRVHTSRRYSNSFMTSVELLDADSSLVGAPLDRDITEVPEGTLSTAISNRLYIGGDPLDPDVVYWSDKDNPEKFDTLFNSVTLGDGSGNIQIGMVSMLGSVFVFKPNGIWQITDVGGGQHTVSNVSQIGAISRDSIEVVTDPDTGRSGIFFFSQDGPYMFDGSTPRYIGTPIEDPDIGFAWLDPTSVITAHNPTDREVMFIYKPIATIAGNPTKYSRNSEAAVFNYRTREWYFYTGLIANSTLTIKYVNDSVVTDPDLPASIIRTFGNKLFIGGYNGRTYLWDSGVLDGVVNTFTPTNPYTITNIASNSYTLSGTTAIPAKSTTDISGCWATFVDSVTGNWFSTPIITNSSSTTGVIQVSTEWSSLWPFTPNLTTQVYISFIPGLIEFPWDVLEVPFVDKQIVELVTWHKGTFVFRTSVGHDTATVTTWKAVETGLGRRHKTQVNRRADAIKLELASFDPTAKLDALDYTISYSEDGNTPLT